MQWHAKLSPSSSWRWLHCAGSIPLNAGPGAYSSFYAGQGTAAHALLEMCNRLDTDPHQFLGTDMHEGHVVDEDMADAVAFALDYVNSYIKRYPRTLLWIEKEVDPYRLLKCEPGYTSGTPDLMLDNALLAELTAIDYKHGAGIPVEVGGNTQLLQYLVAYWSQHCHRPYQTYRGVIVQPRSRHAEGPVREVLYTHDDIMEHAKRLKRRVVQIAKYPDQRTAGDWCKWCRGAARCKTLAAKALEAAGIEFTNLAARESSPEPTDPHGFTDRELAQIMGLADMLESWLKQVRAAMMTALQQGRDMHGWKLVLGRSVRSWRDEQTVQATLARMGYKADAYAPRALLGVAPIERLLKQKHRGRKKDFVLPQPLLTQVARSVPPLHVAPADDPRPAVQRGQEFLNQGDSSDDGQKAG